MATLQKEQKKNTDKPTSPEEIIKWQAETIVELRGLIKNLQDELERLYDNLEVLE